MKRAMSVIVGLISIFIIFLGVVASCDPQKAQREEIRGKLQLTEEETNQQLQNEQKLRRQLEQYKVDFGAYPRSLEDLKKAGYDFPEKPLPGWEWSYQLTVPQVYDLATYPEE